MKTDRIDTQIQVGERTIPLHIHMVKRGTRVSIVRSYGMLDCAIGTRLGLDRGLTIIRTMLPKLSSPALPDMSFTPMLDWKNKTIWYLGKKRRILPVPTSGDDYVSHRSSRGFTAEFDQRARSVLEALLKRESARAGIPLPASYTIRMGKFRGKLASLTIRAHIFTFDRRLLAFAPNVIASVVDHELTHVLVAKHDRNFYNTLYSFADRETIRKHDLIISSGHFWEKE